MKKRAYLLLASFLVIALVAGCGGPEVVGDEGEFGEKTTIRVAALKGPTGIGLVKLMAANEEGTAANHYEFELVGAPDEIVALLTSKSVDVAAVPTNLAAVLYNKTQGDIQLMAINTLGVLYIVEKGDSVHSLADLAGRTITGTGQVQPRNMPKFSAGEEGAYPGKM